MSRKTRRDTLRSTTGNHITMTTKELVARVQQLDTPMYSAEDVRQRLGISTMSLMTDSDPELPVNEASLKKMVESSQLRV